MPAHTWQAHTCARKARASSQVKSSALPASHAPPNLPDTQEGSTARNKHEQPPATQVTAPKCVHVPTGLRAAGGAVLNGGCIPKGHVRSLWERIPRCDVDFERWRHPHKRYRRRGYIHTCTQGLYRCLFRSPTRQPQPQVATLPCQTRLHPHKAAYGHTNV